MREIMQAEPIPFPKRYQKESYRVLSGWEDFVRPELISILNRAMTPELLFGCEDSYLELTLRDQELDEAVWLHDGISKVRFRFEDGGALTQLGIYYVHPDTHEMNLMIIIDYSKNFYNNDAYEGRLRHCRSVYDILEESLVDCLRCASFEDAKFKRNK